MILETTRSIGRYVFSLHRQVPSKRGRPRISATLRALAYFNFALLRFNIGSREALIAKPVMMGEILHLAPYS
jgi:hypothetical protein